MSTEAYNVMNLVLQFIVSIAILGTFWVYLGQLRAMRDGAKGQNILAVVNFLQAPEVRTARTTVRRDLKTKPHSDWTPDDQRAADLVCSTYDVAAVLIFQERLVPQQPFLKNWGPSIRDCYEILRPRIEELQRAEQSGPEYWDDFARLYAAAKGKKS